MIVISEPTLPKNLNRMHPELLALDAGFSESNYEALLEVVRGEIDSKTRRYIIDLAHEETDPEFYAFFELYDFLIVKNKKVRLLLPEIGYSPYNFMLLINCLGQDKRQIAELLNCSFSKISVNTAIRSSEHFMPMVGRQWNDFLAYFMEVLELSDKKYGVKRDYNKVFYMLGDRQTPLKLPS